MNMTEKHLDVEYKMAIVELPKKLQESITKLREISGTLRDIYHILESDYRRGKDGRD